MATTLKAFQQEISSISDQKKAEHLRELRQAQQVANDRVKGGPSKVAGTGHVKGKTSKDIKDAKDLSKSKDVKVDGQQDEVEEEGVNAPEVSIEVSSPKQAAAAFHTRIMANLATDLFTLRTFCMKPSQYHMMQEPPWTQPTTPFETTSADS